MPSTVPVSPADAVRPRGDRQRPLARVRQDRILDMLKAFGSVTVAEIAADLGISDMTVRRDLIELERAGWLERIHGGAVAKAGGEPVAMDREEPSFASRLNQRREAKTRIAALAAGIVAGYRTVALDVGTTTYLLAAQLRNLPHTTVFTNSVRIAGALGDGACEVYVPGGRLRRDELSISGASAVAQFGALWFDVAVIGVSGLSTAGIFDYSLEDTEMKQVYLARSGVRIVLCDSAKFRRMSLVKIAGLDRISMLVTDAPPPSDVAVALAQAGVEVRIAGEGAT